MRTKAEVVQELQVFGTAVGGNRTGHAQEVVKRLSFLGRLESFSIFSLVFPVFFSRLQ